MCQWSLVLFINPRRACAARVTVLGLSVRLSAHCYFGTMGYEAANEWHHRLQNNENMVVISPEMTETENKRMHVRLRTHPHWLAMLTRTGLGQCFAAYSLGPTH